MEFEKMKVLSQEVKAVIDLYNQKNHEKKWGSAEYVQGLVGDVGDLTKLVMAKNGFRGGEDVDRKLAHELSDCLWSLIILANELGLDLEKEFPATMEELKEKYKIKTA